MDVVLLRVVEKLVLGLGACVPTRLLAAQRPPDHKPEPHSWCVCVLLALHVGCVLIIKTTKTHQPCCFLGDERRGRKAGFLAPDPDGGLRETENVWVQ